MIDGTGSTIYAYDEQGHLLAVTGPDGRTAGYRYTIDGQRLMLPYPVNEALI